MSFSSRRYFLPIGIIIWVPFASMAAPENINCRNLDDINCIIGSDEELSSLNSSMLRAYDEDLRRLNNKSQKIFQNLQNHWLESRGANCKTKQSNFENIISCLKEYYKHRVSELTQKCEWDKNNDIGQMAAWKHPWSNKIPIDFKIDPHIGIYIADRVPPNYTTPYAYNLPSTELPAARQAGFGIRLPSPFFSVCRVKAPDEKWWVVGQNSADLTFWYLPASNAESVNLYHSK